MTVIKVVRNFVNQVTKFVYFDVISKMRLQQLKNNILMMYLIYIRNHAFQPWSPQNSNLFQKDFTGIIFLTIVIIQKNFNMGYGPPPAPQRSKNIPPNEGLKSVDIIATFASSKTRRNKYFCQFQLISKAKMHTPLYQVMEGKSIWPPIP